MKKEINICNQKEITTYLNYSLPLCVILNDQMKQDWILEHFSNIYLMYGEQGYIWLDFLEDLYFPQEVLEYKFLDANQMMHQTNLKEFILEKINQDYCLMIFVDMYFICNSPLYMKAHEVEQLFLFGYDKKNNELYGIGFEKNFKFEKITYNYDEIVEGYKSCLERYQNFPIWVKDYNLIYMKIKNPNIKYEANVKKIFEGIIKFRNSKGCESDLRPEIIIERGNIAYFGIAAQKRMAEGFKKLYEGQFVLDYRYMHLLTEHKRLMLSKLKYILTYLHLEENLSEEIREYSEIVNQYAKIEKVFLKNTLVDNNMKTIYGQLKNKQIIIKIYDKLQELILDEIKILDFMINKTSILLI